MVNLAILLLSGCADQPVILLQGETMGTYYRVKSLCQQSTSEKRLQTEVEQVLDAVNQTASNYLPDSEVNAVQLHNLHQWYPISPALAQVLHIAKEVHKNSDGAFDVTVAPLVRLWGFGPNANTQLPPTDAAVAAARELIDLSALGVHTNAKAESRLRRHKAVELDLSAVAKGYAVDRVSELLQAQGCPNHLVDIGGEVRARGVNDRGGPWRVGIETPDSVTYGTVSSVVELVDMAVATSGDYRNFIDLDNKRWSHTIDPRTGYPVQQPLASVSVVHRSAALADAWATALSVLGADEALALANSERFAVLLLLRDAEGFQARYNDAMLQLLDQPVQAAGS